MIKVSVKKIFINLCAVFAAALSLLSACGGGQELHLTAFNGTPVVVQSRNKPIPDAVKTKIENLLDDLNAEFSATLETSTTYKINSAKAGEKTEISKRYKAVADVCRELAIFTDGKFDVSVYPLTLLWQFAPNYPVPEFSVPEKEDIAIAKSVCGIDKFTFNDYAEKTVDGAKIDFGGALKGYAADEIAKILKEDGVTRGFVNVGGSSLNLISMDNVSIVHPRKDGNILSVKIKGKDLSVSTSGDYEKTYTLGGKTYSHIINPETGTPANGGVASATVIGKNGLKLDALTTAMCVCAHDFENPSSGELYGFIKKILSTEEFGDAQIFAVCIDGENKHILTNKKQGENFALLDTDYQIIYID